MASSLFSYNISRPYPYAWFAPVVIIGGVLAAVLFSTINLASSGYYLSVEYSPNPNSTVSRNFWFSKWPIAGKVMPTCQPQNIEVNSEFFTNQSALTYTVTNIWRRSENGNIASPSLIYYNNLFRDCTVNSIGVDLAATDRQPVQITWSQYGATASAFITCSVINEAGTTMVNLTTTYDYVPVTASYQSGLFSFAGPHNETRASLWWAESLLSMYWAFLSRELQDIRANMTELDQYPIRKGTIFFTPNSTYSNDITNLDFLNVDYRFFNEGLAVDVLYPGNNDFPPSIKSLDKNRTYPNIWTASDGLAKSLYSTIMVDLGQTASNASNVLLNSTALQFYTANFPFMLKHIANAQPGPAQLPFDQLRDLKGSLGITPSVILTEYLCQVPQLKSFGTLFTSILIADLVFLQALWKLLNLGTTGMLLRKKPEANYCLGCTQNGAAWLNETPIDEQHLITKDSSHPFAHRRTESSQSSFMLGSLQSKKPTKDTPTNWL